MGSGSSDDLFGKFNEVEVGKAKEALSRCTNCGRFVLIGPPRSGKTFFRENYLEGKEGRLGAGVTVDEHIPGIATTAKTEGEEAKGELGLREKAMMLLKRMIPLIGNFADKERVDGEELRRILGDRAPKHIVEGAKGIIRDSPHRAYYIPWECVEKPNACTSDADASKALGLIKTVFDDRNKGVSDDRKVTIKWFNAEYIPPGLVEEVIELIREKGEDGARRVLEGWVDAYFEAIEALSKVLGLKKNLLEWDEVAIGFLSNFVNNSAKYVIGGLAATPLMGAASLALVSVLTYIAFKEEGEGYLKEIIGLRRSLEGLLVKGPDGRLDFNELGRLLVYRVAYAMGMSYDEAKEALMDITGLSIEELERRVNEIGKRIEELEEKIRKLEKKIGLSRQEEPAGIVTADVNEFAKGRIYPNIKVESGELRIRVEDGYHSIVRAGKFNELVNEIRGRLTSDGVVVVVGPKGIGKSTLAAAVIWELFMNGDIGLVARVDVLNEDNYQRFKTFIENYSEELVKYFGRLLILYDPVSTETYEREPSTQQGRGALTKTGGGVRRVRYAKMPSDVETTIANLINASSELGDLRPPILIVLPSDIYNTLSEEVRNALEVYRLDVSQALSDREFLAGLIREYTRTKGNPNGCALRDRELSELVGKLAKFDSGRALIARLVGEELARSNCDVGKIEELINNAKGKAKAFIILHINGLFKIHENPNTAKALVEIFTLRKPFVDSVRPSVPIVTPGIVELISEKRGASLLQSAEGEELRGWLAIRQHDLIEEAIGKLLDCVGGKGEGCEDFGSALELWKTIGVMETLKEVSEKVSDADSAVKYFAGNYGEKLTNALKLFSNKCWRRAALIIGHALAGHPIVPRPEDLPESLRKDFAESLGDALRECGVDDYLLVGNKIPPLIVNLTKDHAYALAEAFIDRYNEAVSEVRRVLGIARDRGISNAEEFYGLGLASIIAKAVESGKPIEPGDADAALHIASFTIQYVASPDLIKSVLGALEPLHGKAPHRYLSLLSSALSIENLDSNTVRYVFDKLNEVLDKYGDVVRGYAWSLVHAISAYANLLRRYRIYLYFSDEVKGAVRKIADLLNELDKFKSSLGVIAWAYALAPALEYEDIMKLMMETLRINKVDEVIDKASEILKKLGGLEGRIQELMGDEEFMSFVESRYLKADEGAVKKEIKEILGISSLLRHALARYRLNNDELDKAKELFNEAAKESREIGDYEDYLIDRGLALRVEAIKGPLVCDKLTKLRNEFQRLYEETFSKEHFKLTDRYLGIASGTLGDYLVSLALTGDDKKINELLEEHWLVLRINEQVSVLTRLMLNALLRPKDRKDQLGSELKDKLGIDSRELINAFGSDIYMYIEFLPALRVALGITRPKDETAVCMLINDSTKRMDCMYAISAAMNDNAAVVQLRERLIDTFRGLLFEKLGLLKELGADADALLNEFRGLVSVLDGKFLVQLIAPENSIARLALMLHALVNGNEKLAKAHALMGTTDLIRESEFISWFWFTSIIISKSKLLMRLFLEAYRVCCDLKSESFRRAIAKLFLYHV